MKRALALVILAATGCETTPTPTSAGPDSLLHVQTSSEGIILGAKTIGILSAPETITFTDRPFRKALRHDARSFSAALNAANVAIEGVATTAFGRGRSVPIRVNVRHSTYDEYSDSTFYEVDVKDSDAATMAAYTKEATGSRVVPGTFYFQTTDSKLNTELLAHPSKPDPVSAQLTLTVGGKPTVFHDERECYTGMRKEIGELIAADLAAAPKEVRDAVDAFHHAPGEVPSVLDAYLDKLAATLSDKAGLPNDPLLKKSMTNGLRYVALGPQHAMALLLGRGMCKGLPFGEELAMKTLDAMSSYPGMSADCLDAVRASTRVRLDSGSRVGMCRALIDGLGSGARLGRCATRAADQIISEEPYRGFLAGLGCEVSK